MKKLNGEIKGRDVNGSANSVLLTNIDYLNFPKKRGESSVPALNIKTVVKTTGKKESFSWEKIETSVILAGKDTKAYGKKKAQEIYKKPA